MRKKIVTGMLAVSLVFMMTGCCLSHDWQEAVCTEPKTCSKCGETEGEALGHTWEDATCTEPKICSVCQETEGEALGHTLSEATYWEAAVCSVCGETGDVLPPAFEELGVKGRFMEVGKTYDYNTLCASRQEYEDMMIDTLKEEFGIEGDYANFTEFFMEGIFGDVDTVMLDGEKVKFTEEIVVRLFCNQYGITDDFENLTEALMAVLKNEGIDVDARTTAQVTVTDYQTFDSDEMHEAKEGYEWKTLEIELVYSDENAYNYGASVRYCHDSYYQKDEEDSGEDSENEESWDNEQSYAMDWKGQQYTECKAIIEFEEGDWIEDAAGGHSYTRTIMVTFLLPKGYDGKLFSLADYGYTGTIKNFAYADDNTLFFRLR